MDAGVEMKDMILGCTSGIPQHGNNEPVLDMNYNEESNCRAHLTIGYLPRKERVAMMELKNSKLQIDDYNRLMELAIEGCGEIQQDLRKFLYKSYIDKLITSN
jgi:ribonuclease PH